MTARDLFFVSTQCESREWCNLDSVSWKGGSREISSGDLDAELDSVGCEVFFFF